VVGLAGPNLTGGLSALVNQLDWTGANGPVQVEEALRALPLAGPDHEAVGDAVDDPLRVLGVGRRGLRHPVGDGVARRGGGAGGVCRRRITTTLPPPHRRVGTMLAVA